MPSVSLKRFICRKRLILIAVIVTLAIAGGFLKAVATREKRSDFTSLNRSPKAQIRARLADEQLMDVNRLLERSYDAEEDFSEEIEVFEIPHKAQRPGESIRVPLHPDSHELGDQPAGGAPSKALAFKHQSFHEETATASTTTTLTNKPELDPNVVVYNIYQDPGGRYTCLPLKTTPTAPICLYAEGEENRVSPAIRHRGLWQAYTVEVFQQALEENANLGVIDIGANLGQFSLIAAVRKRSALAVEPFAQHLRRFNKAAILGSLQRNIVVLQNVVSDKRGLVSLHVSSEHPGHAVPLDVLRKDSRSPRVDAIYCDDIVPYVRFKKAIIVIDPDAHPQRVLARGGRLFNQTEIHFVFMGWTRIRFYLVNNYTLQVKLIGDMMALLRSHDLDPYDPRGMIGLGHLPWKDWPDAVMWARKSTKMVQKWNKKKQ